MIGWRLYAAAGLVVAVAGGLGYVSVLKGNLDTAQAEIATHERSIAALKSTAEKTRQAREVAEARAIFWEARSVKLDASIEALFSEDIPDAPLDPRIAAIINGSLHND